LIININKTYHELLCVRVRVEGRATSEAMGKVEEEMKLYKEVVIGRNQFILTWMRLANKNRGEFFPNYEEK